MIRFSFIRSYTLCLSFLSIIIVMKWFGIHAYVSYKRNNNNDTNIVHVLWFFEFFLVSKLISRSLRQCICSVVEPHSFPFLSCHSHPSVLNIILILARCTDGWLCCYWKTRARTIYVNNRLSVDSLFSIFLRANKLMEKYKPSHIFFFSFPISFDSLAATIALAGIYWFMGIWRG